jgi:starvation-inducible DNA-binding protein
MGRRRTVKEITVRPIWPYFNTDRRRRSVNPHTASRATSPHKLKTILDSHPFLSEHERHEVANELQATLVDLIDLTLIGKQMHWNVVGPHFRSLHLALDEFIDSWRLMSDTVAERITALGLSPDGRAATIAGDSEIAAVHDGAIKDDDLIDELKKRLAIASS